VADAVVDAGCSEENGVASVVFGVENNDPGAGAENNVEDNGVVDVVTGLPNCNGAALTVVTAADVVVGALASDVTSVLVLGRPKVIGAGVAVEVVGCSDALLKPKTNPEPPDCTGANEVGLKAGAAVLLAWSAPVFAELPGFGDAQHTQLSTVASFGTQHSPQVHLPLAVFGLSSDGLSFFSGSTFPFAVSFSSVAFSLLSAGLNGNREGGCKSDGDLAATSAGFSASFSAGVMRISGEFVRNSDSFAGRWPAKFVAFGGAGVAAFEASPESSDVSESYGVVVFLLEVATSVSLSSCSEPSVSGEDSFSKERLTEVCRGSLTMGLEKVNAISSMALDMKPAFGAKESGFTLDKASTSPSVVRRSSSLT
jgi:hypothetical protein